MAAIDAARQATDDLGEAQADLVPMLRAFDRAEAIAGSARGPPPPPPPELWKTRRSSRGGKSGARHRRAVSRAIERAD